MASGGCSRLEIQGHIAAVRYEATDACNLASHLASGLQSVMLTRMVPIADVEFGNAYVSDAATEAAFLSVSISLIR
jgi:hypothetical protein